MSKLGWDLTAMLLRQEARKRPGTVRLVCKRMRGDPTVRRLFAELCQHTQLERANRMRLGDQLRMPGIPQQCVVGISHGVVTCWPSNGSPRSISLHCFQWPMPITDNDPGARRMWRARKLTQVEERVWLVE